MTSFDQVKLLRETTERLVGNEISPETAGILLAIVQEIRKIQGSQPQ